MRHFIRLFFISCYSIHMMGNFGQGWGMMGGAMGIWAAITWLVVLIDLVLLGIWLWQKIK